MKTVWRVLLLSCLCTAAGAGMQAATPHLNAHAAIVYDQFRGETLLAKNAGEQASIASITKLMTIVVVLDAGQALDERITIMSSDAVFQTGSPSRLPVGSTHSREQLMNLALIPSDNRAAHALGRSYPGGLDAFVTAMNRKAHQLGMQNTRYAEPTGLSSINQSTAEDLVKLVDHAYSRYAKIREISSRENYSASFSAPEAKQPDRAMRHAVYQNTSFNNTNKLTRDEDWQIGLSKTGYITRAGHCLVMQAEISQRPVIIVLLDTGGSVARIEDANQIKQWLEAMGPPEAIPHAVIKPLEPILSCTLSPCLGQNN